MELDRTYHAHEFSFSYLFFYIFLFITPDKGGGKCVWPRLSVCLLARSLKNACLDLDEMLRADRCQDMDEPINFWARFGL